MPRGDRPISGNLCWGGSREEVWQPIPSSCSAAAEGRKRPPPGIHPLSWGQGLVPAGMHAGPGLRFDWVWGGGTGRARTRPFCSLQLETTSIWGYLRLTHPTPHPCRRATSCCWRAWQCCWGRAGVPPPATAAGSTEADGGLLQTLVATTYLVLPWPLLQPGRLRSQRSGALPIHAGSDYPAEGSSRGGMPALPMIAWRRY